MSSHTFPSSMPTDLIRRAKSVRALMADRAKALAILATYSASGGVLLLGAATYFVLNDRSSLAYLFLSFIFGLVLSAVCLVLLKARAPYFRAFDTLRDGFAEKGTISISSDFAEKLVSADKLDIPATLAIKTQTGQSIQQVSLYTVDPDSDRSFRIWARNALQSKPTGRIQAFIYAWSDPQTGKASGIGLDNFILMLK